MPDFNFKKFTLSFPKAKLSYVGLRCGTTIVNVSVFFFYYFVEKWIHIFIIVVPLTKYADDHLQITTSLNYKVATTNHAILNQIVLQTM